MGDKKTLRADNYFAIIPEWILYAKISSNAVRLYGVLARYADKESGDCFPSRATISERSGLSDALISKATKELVDLGALRVHRRKLDNGGWASNLYTILSANPTPSAEIVEGVLPESQKPSAEIDPSPSAGIGALTRVTINQSQLTREKDSLSLVSLGRKDAEDLANLLADRIEANGSKRPTVTKAWITDMDRLMRLDGRTALQVRLAIEWCQQDSFWSTNILSPAKLREKYDQLRLKASQQAKKTQPKGLKAIMEIRAEEEAKMKGAQYALQG